MKMKLGEIGHILKFFIMIFNSVYVILGFAILGCGIWILFDKSSFIITISSKETIRIVASGLCVIGLLVIAICVLGYVGVAKEIRCFIIMHVIFLLPIFFGVIFVTSVLMMSTDMITEALIDEVDKIISVYGNKTANGIMAMKWMLLDAVQHYRSCCGRLNYTQWETNVFVLSLAESNVYPCSCFNTTVCPFLKSSRTNRFGVGRAIHPMVRKHFFPSASIAIPVENLCCYFIIFDKNFMNLRTEQFFEQGCQKSIEDWLWETELTILCMDIGLASVEVIQLILVALFCLNIGRKGKQVHTEQALIFLEASAERNTV